MLIHHLVQIKHLALGGYLLSIGYIHFRGQVRLKLIRQITDHSSLMAPINMLMYIFSAVPRTPYIDLQHFPELEILSKHWEVIRDEAEKLYVEGYIAASDRYDDIGFNSFFRRGWKRFYLKWYSTPLDSALIHCPKTLALIESLPNINAAMFALLPKQSFLFEHRDPYAGSLRYHLGLTTPNAKECCIYVDGKPYFWQDGEAVIFDETYVHRAENTTQEDRIILFCDIRRPLTNKLTTQLNLLFSRTVMKAAASKNTPFERVGVINTLFSYAYRIRLLAKRLKVFNKPLYYVVKYIFYFSLIYLIFI